MTSGSGAGRVDVRVYAPDAERVVVVADDDERDLRRDGEYWVGEVAAGSRYALRAVGPDHRFDRSLVDPAAVEVSFPPAHRRAAARPHAPSNVGRAPLAVARSSPPCQPPRRTSRPLVVYETHVRGFTKRRERDAAGTFAGMIAELPRLAELGVSVVELLPVQQFDPDEGNYWGYMPLVFGAIHRQYAVGDDPAAEFAEFVSAAHDADIEVWLDVVFNHTTEEDETGPTYNLRGLADRAYYVVDDDGVYVDDAGTGNIIDATSPPAQRLILDSLDRLADLGIDGFRFDLATVLARDPDFVRAIGDWSVGRGVRLIAEPWDLARYQLGRSFPDDRWAQWNGRFRDDMRSFLRGEPSMVSAVMRRIEGSPDLFDAPLDSVNFITSHDGFTLYDLVAYDHKHNDANGWGNADGHGDNRSWNCGWEGDVGLTGALATEVYARRRRQKRNAMCLLVLSHGTPMFVAGDEFARTQHGNNNPYNQDNEISWVDWARADEYADHEAFVRRLLAFRAAHPVLTQPEPWGDDVEWFGIDGAPDVGPQSRSLAWHVDGIYVMANMWWEPLEFAVQVPGRWRVTIDTTRDGSGDGDVDDVDSAVNHVTVGPRSIVVLTPG